MGKEQVRVAGSAQAHLENIARTNPFGYEFVTVYSKEIQAMGNAWFTRSCRIVLETPFFSRTFLWAVVSL
jgi:hypothetical protein